MPVFKKAKAQEATEKMLDIFSFSNLYTGLHSVYRETAAFGTGHFHKQQIDKPSCVSQVARKYFRYEDCDKHTQRNTYPVWYIYKSQLLAIVVA